MIPENPKESFLYLKIPMHSVIEVDGSFRISLKSILSLNLVLETGETIKKEQVLR